MKMMSKVALGKGWPLNVGCLEVRLLGGLGEVDLGRIPGKLVILFPQPLCRLLNLIFQGSLTRFRDLEREKLTSARLAEIGVGELFLKSSSGSSEF